MILLVSGATRTLQRLTPETDKLGFLATPSGGHSRETVAGFDVWAMDNDAYSPKIPFDPGAFAYGKFDPVSFVDMLKRYRGIPGCKFVVCPDVVGDARATLARLPVWMETIRHYGYPVALAAQDGLDYLRVPWAYIDALFIGASTEWKLSEHARALVGEAKRRGKWVHMGRVNSVRRIRIAQNWGVDSVDGSGFSIQPDAKLTRILPVLETRQPLLWASTER